MTKYYRVHYNAKFTPTDDQNELTGIGAGHVKEKLQVSVGTVLLCTYGR
jgi:hypothetical protein